MDTALFHQHLRHFSQATETQGGEEFRKGTLDIDNLPVYKYTKKFLHELTRTKDNPPEINTQLQAPDIRYNYKNWKEATTTSPSCRYLSLYKTWLGVSEEKEDDYDGITSDNFFQLITNVITVAKALSHPLQR
eukprot:13518861-Ditylum_brightwellii.AAC.1